MVRQLIGGLLAFACTSLWLAFHLSMMKHSKKFLTTFSIEVSLLIFLLSPTEIPHYKIIDIEWPEGDEALSNEAMEAVELLLNMDHQKRPAAKEVQEMQFFKSVDWKNLEHATPPFIPTLDDPTDTGYFEPRNVMQHLQLSNFHPEDWISSLTFEI